MSDANPFHSPSSPYKSVEAPFAANRAPAPQSIGGWLILLGIAVVFAPFRVGLMIVVFFIPEYMDGTWEILTTPGSEHYHALWAPILIFEWVMNFALMLCYVGVAILFFQRSRLFPRAYIALAIANVILVLTDSWLGTLVMPDEPIFDFDTGREIFRSLFAILVWGSYLMVSQRSKNTFVR